MGSSQFGHGNEAKTARFALIARGNVISDAGGYQRTILGFGSRTANMCVNNWPSYTPFSYVGEAVIHEWAHGCGWDHGQGAGVPMNSGGPQ
jgi:hypothetical protein